ncbi:MAG: hypothetical protein ACLGI6_11705 [Gammaproteobacteria bacterium]
MKIATLMLAASVCLLSACGGSSDDHPDQPMTPPTPPAPTQPAADAFYSLVSAVTSAPEDAEPQAVEQFSATAPEDSEPVPFGS